jgi:hypothetical protein
MNPVAVCGSKVSELAENIPFIAYRHDGSLILLRFGHQFELSRHGLFALDRFSHLSHRHSLRHIFHSGVPFRRLHDLV